MKRLIIVGSPRTNGRCAHLAEQLFEANIDEHPEDELFLVPVSEIEAGPCIGCNACRATSPVTFKGDDGAEVTEERHRCVFDDDMQTVYDLLDEADELVVVSPVFFSGAPAPMKCIIDRLQPYFWARDELRRSGAELPQKRPLALHVIGEGGDPHGYDALVSEVKSSFALADFGLERLLDWVGKITPEGEVTAEATEYTFDLPGVAGYGSTWKTGDGAPEGEAPRGAQPAKKPRPKLDLSSGIWAEDDDEPARPAASGKPKKAGAQARGKVQQGKPGAAKAAGAGKSTHSGKGRGSAPAAKQGRGKASGKPASGKSGRADARTPKSGSGQGKRHGR